MSAKGLDTFFDVLSLIKNPKQFEQKLKELSEETKKYETVITSVVGLQSVQDFIKDIEQNKTKAELLVKEAQDNYKLLQEQLEEKKKNNLLEINKELEELAKVKVHVTSIDILNKSKQKKLDAQEKSIIEKTKVLAEKEEFLQKLNQEVEIKKQKLLSALND